MRINKPLLALALPALLFTLLFKPVAALAQRIVVPYSGQPGSVLVYDANGVVITNLANVTTPLHPGTYISNPYGVATDNSGNIYVANVNDGTNGWVAEFGPDYHLVRSNLTRLPTNYPPGDLAVDQEGFIYVAKYSNGGSILRFDPSGFLVSNYTNGSLWGFDGARSGNSGIACTGSNIYSPLYGGAFQIYAGGLENGALENKFSTNAPALSQFDAVATDGYGNLYAFQVNPGPFEFGTVYRFDPNGNYLGGFDISNAVYGIVVDYSGNIYVGVSGLGDSGVEEYDYHHHVVRNIPNTLNFGGHFAVQPPPPQLGLTTVSNATLAFWTPAATNYVLQSVTNAGATNWLAVTNGTPIAALGFTDNFPARFFRYPVNNFTEFTSSIFVSDYNYNQDGGSGIFACSFSPPEEGISAGDYVAPEGVAIDVNDNVYVADQGTGTIWKFGARVNVAAVSGLSNPYALAVDEAGNIYVTSASYFGSGSPVLKYDSSGYFIANIGYSDGALAVCKGNIYTSTNGNLAAFNSTGQLIALNTSISPAGLAADYRGYVYAIDGSGAVHKYDLNLNPIPGYSVNDPNSAAAAYGWGGIAVDLGGNLYVLRGDDGVDEYDGNGNLLNSVSGLDYGAPQFIAAPSAPLPVKFASAGNQSIFYWTSAVPLTPAMSNSLMGTISNFYVHPVLSVTNLASTNWLPATDIVPGMGMIISNSPPGSVFRLQVAP